MDKDGKVFLEKTSNRTSDTFRCFWHSLNNINNNGYWHDPNYPNAHLTYIVSFDKYTIAFSIKQTQFPKYISGFSYIGMIDYADSHLGNIDNFGSSGNVLLSHNNLQKRVGIIPNSDNESDIGDFNYSLVIDWSKNKYGVNGVTNVLYNYNDFTLTVTKGFYKIFSFNSSLGQYRIGNCPELNILYEANKQKITISFKKEAFLQNNIYRFFFGMNYCKANYFSGDNKRICYSVYPFSLYIKDNYTNSSQRSFSCQSYYIPCLQNMGVNYLARVNEYVNEYYDYYNEIYKNDYLGYWIYPFLVVNTNNLDIYKIFKKSYLYYYSSGYINVSPELCYLTSRPKMEDFLTERDKDKFWFEAVKSELNNTDASFELYGGVAAKKLKKYNISSYSNYEFDSNNYKKLTTKSSFVDKTLLSKIGIQDNKNIILGYLRRACSLEDKNSYDGKKFIVNENEEYVTLKRAGCKDLINNMSNNIFQQVLLKKDN